MALPVILVNSATGSDTLASGAGPGTALTGSAGVSSASGLVVTLDGSPNLTGVATDGSHVIFFNDATAGNRNFGKITNTDNNAKTVTVADAFGVNLTKAWAIGGVRASIDSTTSLKLIDNNAAAGDAMPGWAIEMQSGHTETIAATITIRRAGDATNGPIILRGTSGAVTPPILTFSNNGDAFTTAIASWVFRDFQMQNSNATKTASIAFHLTSGSNQVTIKNIKIADSTNKFWQGIYFHANNNDNFVEDCEIGRCANVGMLMDAGVIGDLRIINNWIHDCSSHGFDFSSPSGQISGTTIRGNIFAYNGGSGINSADATSTADGVLFTDNVFHGNTGDGIKVAWTAAHSGMFQGLLIENNRFTFNGGFGINMSGASVTDAMLAGVAAIIRNNNFFSNTSGKYAGMTITSSINEVTVDPSGGSASATKDYTGAVGGSNFMSAVSKALGYPIGGTLAVGTGSSSYSYEDMGLQHQDAGGGGGGVVQEVWTGGFRG